MKKAILAFGLFCTSAVVTAHPTTKQLAEQVRQKGAQAVITDLYADNDGKEWQYVTGEIAKGDDHWLNVAAMLAPGSDAESAEMLSQAIGAAIPHNPSAVLNIITERFIPLSLREICGLPFYSMTETELNQYIMDSVRALYKVPSGKACMDTMINVIGASDGFNEDN